jgi:hypothetical protein
MAGIVGLSEFYLLNVIDHVTPDMSKEDIIALAQSKLPYISNLIVSKEDHLAALAEYGM